MSSHTFFRCCYCTAIGPESFVGDKGFRTFGKPLSSSFLGNGNGLTFAWKSLKVSEKLKLKLGPRELGRGMVLIRAVATFESECLVHKEDGSIGEYNSQLGFGSDRTRISLFKSVAEESTKLEEREKLRRMRISKANKGNMPWNKGRKHSPETLKRIRERTRLAMQDPKVKMKLANLGHAQSKETRKKIAVGVRIGWQRRNKKLMVQEACYFEWQSLIAEASRNGFIGEEELQWDSYKIMDKQHEQEWLEIVGHRKTMPGPKGSKTGPKSPEQRRKIAEAIAAKWADPEYRDRVCSGLARYHGIPVGVERPRRRPNGNTRSTRRSSTRKRPSDDNDSSSTSNMASQILLPRLRRSNAPLYKDPLASSKLEMIKNIRAQRAAAETKKIEAAESKKTAAITSARLIIAEAEKAARILEVAAMKNPAVQASLIETRKLIAEAVQSIESVETRSKKDNGQ